MTRTLAALFFIWMGLLAGISFVATPAKFLAPSLPLAQALDVGRWTFHVLAQIEWGFVVVTAAMLGFAWSRGKSVGLIAILTGCVATILGIETFALRPMLDERVLRIMAGESVPPNASHNIYIALEAVRLALICAAGVIAIRRTESLAA